MYGAVSAVTPTSAVRVWLCIMKQIYTAQSGRGGMGRAVGAERQVALGRLQRESPLDQGAHVAA